MLGPSLRQNKELVWGQGGWQTHTEKLCYKEILRKEIIFASQEAQEKQIRS